MLMNELTPEKTARVEEKSQQWLTLQLGEQAYAVNVLQVEGIQKATEISPVAGAPGYVLGVMNLRGYLVTVIDMRIRLDIPIDDNDMGTRIIFVEVRGHIIGMLVDHVTEVISLPTSGIDSDLYIKDKVAHLEGIYSNNGQSLLLMDVERLFEAEEWPEASGF